MQNQAKKLDMQKLLAPLALVILYIVFSIFGTNFLSLDMVKNILESSYYIGFMAFGVTFIIITGGIDLSLGTVMMCAALLGGYTFKQGWPLILSVLLTILIGVVFGFINGMGRYGFLPSDVDKIIPIYAYMDAIAISGIYTHLHSAFCNKKVTRLQAAAFDGVLQAIKKAGYETGMPHICNSAGLLRFPDLAMGGVRIGSAILGRLSFKGSYGLKRVGVCEAAIDEIRWLPKGHTCGYGAA